MQKILAIESINLSNFFILQVTAQFEDAGVDNGQATQKNAYSWSFPMCCIFTQITIMLGPTSNVNTGMAH